MLAKTGGVAQAALDLVGQDGGGDQVAPAASGDLPDGKDGGQVITGMGRRQGQIRIVVVEVTNEQAVDEGGPLGTALATADHARRRVALHAASAGAGNGEGIGVEGAGGGGERVD